MIKGGEKNREERETSRGRRMEEEEGEAIHSLSVSGKS
jgi:hypothetical protein